MENFVKELISDKEQVDKKLDALYNTTIYSLAIATIVGLIAGGVFGLYVAFNI